MNDAEHSLYDYDPDLYRLIHIGNPGDVAFYSEACDGVESVLELGCGWGRISSEVAPLVDRFVGLDINPAMIRAAREECASADGDRATFVAGDMRDFELGAVFERVIIPYNSLYNLLSVDDVLSCLRCVRRHLDDGGLLVFDGYHIDPMSHRAMSEQGGVDDDLIGVFASEDRTVEVIEFSDYDMPDQRIDTRYLYRFLRGDSAGEQAEYRVPQRFLLPFELEAVLERAGLELESVTGDFFDAPLEAAHAQMVVTATRGKT